MRVTPSLKQSGDGLALSRSRASLVRNYLHARFQLENQNIGTVPLRGVPPPSTHKNSWNGICIVVLSQYVLSERIVDHFFGGNKDHDTRWTGHRGITAALAGSLVGAFSSVAVTFIGQRLQARWTQLRAELAERENLYGLFVEEAVHLFVDAIQRSKIDPVKIMRLYSKVARIRLMSTDQVLHAAEKVGKRLFEAYERPPGDPLGSRAICQRRRQF